jgi:putative transposase
MSHISSKCRKNPLSPGNLWTFYPVIDTRYILAWRLAPTMAATDVQETLDLAFAKTNLTHIKVRHRPRLLSDNGPAFIAEDLKVFLNHYHMEHIRSAPFHPMTQGKSNASIAL